MSRKSEDWGEVDMDAPFGFFRERLAGAPGEDQEFPDLMNIHSTSLDAAQWGAKVEELPLLDMPPAAAVASASCKRPHGPGVSSSKFPNTTSPMPNPAAGILTAPSESVDTR